MAFLLRKISVICFLCMQVTQAVINPLSIPNTFYVEKGVNVVIPWTYTDDDKNLDYRRWYFTNVSNPTSDDFQQLVSITGTDNPKIVSTSPFQNIEVQKPATLIIKNPNKDHSGTYRFLITLNGGVDLTGSNVQVIITATINPLSISNPFYVEKAVNVVIPWTYTDDDKNIDYRRWYFTNISNPASDDFQQLITITGTDNPKKVSSSPFQNIEVQKPATLIIKNPNKEHSGTYRFLITLNGGVDLTGSIVLVIITVPPVVQCNCSDIIEPKEGESVACQCICKDGNPPATASCFKDGKIIGEARPLNKTLLIENIELKDNGTYEFVCQSHTLKVKKDLTIKVKYAPNIISVSNGKDDKTAYLTDETLTIICKADAYPEPTYKIFHNGSLVVNKSVYKKGKKVEYSDAGNYTCEPTNIVGKKNGSFILKVADITKSETRSNSTPSYVIGIACFIGGTVFGMILLYGILLVSRRLSKVKNKSSNEQHSAAEYENAGAERNTTYQELDISKMNDEANYQSLKMNPRSLRQNETAKEDQVGYAELNQVRGNKDENYQSLEAV